MSLFSIRPVTAVRVARSTWLFIIVSLACSATTIISFDQFTDSQALTNQIPGVTFSNTTLLTAGISLNELEFPPHSGTNVAFDSGGPIGITFSSPITSFSGYFTYTVPVNIFAYNAADAAVAQVTSAFSSNLAISGVAGSSPNEFLSVSSAGGINFILLTGDPTGGSFVMDDLTLVSPAATGVPEPSVLLPLGLIVIAFRIRKHVSVV